MKESIFACMNVFIEYKASKYFSFVEFPLA